MHGEQTTKRDGDRIASPERRGFLRQLTLGSVVVSAGPIAAATTLTAATPGAARAARRHPRTVKVFRFRTRNTTSCRACQLHHRYKIFLKRKIAKRNRAHPGCDCPIVPQWLPRPVFRVLFKETGAIERGFVDLRVG